MIGNGFDLAHGMPTDFRRDFKPIAEKYETDYRFWDLYQTRDEDIWSDFENLLAHPDFNELEAIFDGSYPDYTSDRESDRDGIISVAEFSANLKESLSEFANNAEKSLDNVKKKMKFADLFSKDDFFINFNYTHTLERIYDIPQDHVLHIHGEVGGDTLLMGYEDGNFSPESYSLDVRHKGRQYVPVPLEKYINDHNNFDDGYVQTAYSSLYEKCKLLSKENQHKKLNVFLKSNNCIESINEVVAFGLSYGIDIAYYYLIDEMLLNRSYNSEFMWILYCYDYMAYRNLMDNFGPLSNATEPYYGILTRGRPFSLSESDDSEILNKWHYCYILDKEGYSCKG
jgi:hypothetical protein